MNMNMNRIMSRFAEVSNDNMLIKQWIEEIKEDIDSIWLPEKIKEIYLRGYEEGSKQGSGDYDDG